MENSKQKTDCVIFHYQQYGVGGIETATYRYIRDLQKKNIPCICICDKTKYIAPEFRDVMNDEKIIIRANNIRRAELKRLLSHTDQPRITVISYHFDGFVWGERLKRRCKWAVVENFYFMAHFQGEKRFFEDGFKNKYIKRKLIELMRYAYSSIYSSGALRVFSYSHAAELERRYKINIPDKNALKVPNVEKSADISAQEISERFHRKRFNLLTVSRMDFPHKGYVLGLIAAYGRLKPKYPQMELTVVGDGGHMNEVKDAVESLDTEARKDVKLVGTVPPDELEKYYRDANLNISVAGCCTSGMKYGTLCIPARHYDYSCEVYGFMPENMDMTTSTEPGLPCDQFIERVLNMGEEEYVSRCMRGIKAYDEKHPYFSCESIETKNKGPILNRRSEALIAMIYSFIIQKKVLRFRLTVIKEKGIKACISKRLARKRLERRMPRCPKRS